MFNFFSLSSFLLFIFLLYLGLTGLTLLIIYLFFETRETVNTSTKIALSLPFTILTMIVAILFPELRLLILTFITVLSFSLAIVKLLKQQAKETEW